MRTEGYDNWKMAFVPSAVLVAWFVLTYRDGGIIPSVTIGFIYSLMVTSGAFFATGCKALGASVGSVVSMLFWNIIGSTLVSVAVRILRPDLLPTMNVTPWFAMFGYAVLCGMLEAAVHRCDSFWLAAAAGTVIIYFRLPAFILTIPSILRMDAGDGTLTIILVVIGNLIGSSIWSAAGTAPKKKQQ